MELTPLRYFLEVAETQKITATAEKLHIAQPALSQSIHRLEKELGVPLFMPKGRNIVITEYGKYLKERISPVLASLDAIPDDLKAMAHLENSTIHIGMLAASYTVTYAIIAYKKDHPHINFQLIQNDDGNLYDILITTGAPSETKKNDTDRIYREKIFLAVPRTGRFLNKNSIRLADVADEGFIQLGTSRHLRAVCDMYCKNAGFVPKMLFESDNPYTVKNLIASGMGIGFWPEYTWGSPEPEDIALLPLSDIECKRDIVLSCRENKADNRNVIDFYNYLADYMKSKMHIK